MRHLRVRATLLFLGALLVGARAEAQPIYTAHLGGSDEITTDQLKQILADGSAVVFDARPPLEFAMSHIPGALNVAPKPGVPISVYVSDVAEVARLLNDDRSRPLVVYCNGPFCGKSKRLASELRADGWNVRRYQLGIPAWRALVGLTQIEPDAMALVHKLDRTAVWVDVREPVEFARKTIHGAVNIPRSLVLPVKDTGEIKNAKDDGRLPMNDHNTRIIVFGATAADARYVAEALANEAFHNVMFFAGTFREALAASKGEDDEESAQILGGSSSLPECLVGKCGR
jgi:rhodanese-related sulfurtransferase